jgi:hypothetical protein
MSQVRRSQNDILIEKQILCPKAQVALRSFNSLQFLREKRLWANLSGCMCFLAYPIMVYSFEQHRAHSLLDKEIGRLDKHTRQSYLIHTVSFVLASTQELHEKISELSTRVRELEDALRSSHAQLSPEQHPLLTEDLLRIKAPLQRETPSMRNSTVHPHKEEEVNPDVVDAFGSLSLGLSGRAKYYGQIANSWVCDSQLHPCSLPTDFCHVIFQYFLQVGPICDHPHLR